MKRLLFAAALALSAAPAFAEIGGGPNPYQTEQTEQKRRDAEEADKQYKSMIKALPDKPQKADPWGGVRDAEPAAVKAKKTH